MARVPDRRIDIGEQFYNRQLVHRVQTSVSADTDVTPAELETLTDGSDADSLHTHDTLLDEAAHDALAADNPHSVTLTQAVAGESLATAGSGTVPINNHPAASPSAAKWIEVDIAGTTHVIAAWPKV